jgi:molecular chaperone GrpE
MAQRKRVKDEAAAKTPGEAPAPASRAEGVAGASPSVPTDSAPDPPASDPPAPLQGEEEERVESELQDLVAGLERERDEYLELARRTKADFENYRKRVDREAAQAEARGRAALARSLVSVLDNLERALAAAQPMDREAAPNHLAEGVRLVYEELAGVLSNAGVESYEPVGEPFDPNWHEAMMTQPAGADDGGKVLEVLQKGYRLDGQVLRPARVVVGAEENQPSADKPADGFGEG